MGSAFKPSRGNNTNTRKPRGKGIDLSRPADANIQDPPELWTGAKRSLHLSRLHEGNLYNSFLEAGGRINQFLAKANYRVSDRNILQQSPIQDEDPGRYDEDKNALLGLIRDRINIIESAISATISESARDALVQKLTNLQNISAESFDDPQRYASLLEAAFGYNIVLGQDFTDKDEQLRQLTALAQSNLMIVSYLNSIGLSGFAEFQQFFTSTSNGGAVTVHLGDNKKSGGAFVGYVPLPASEPDDSSELDDMYLGSGMTTAAIIHEFFHQLDRYFAQGLSVDDTSDTLTVKEYLTGFVPNSLTGEVGGRRGLSFTSVNVLMGRANPLDDPSELFADYGMTAIVDQYSGTFYAQADNSGDPVAFADSANARDIRCALRQYFLQLMTGTTTDMIYDPELCQ